MKNLIITIIIFCFHFCITSCKITKHINKAIAPRDTTINNATNQSFVDSVKTLTETMSKLQSHHINFTNFNAKIKVEIEDNTGKQPDILAVVRIVKDSAIWVSLSATLFNVEIYRIFITKDSVTLLDMRKKKVQYRSIDYLQDITEIPFEYNTLQNLLVGNPIFLDSAKVVSFKNLDAKILISTLGKYFKNLLTISTNDNLLLHCKLDDVDISRNRTADITYDNFENKDGIDFSTYRQITVSEKNKIDIRLNYKQYEFNKDLSISFKIPKNFKLK